MQIGKLDKRVTIEAPVYTTGAMGDRTITGYTAEATRWASVRAKPEGGSESPETNRITARHSYLVNLRFYDLTTQHRLVCEGKSLQIASVAHDPRGGRDRMTEILAVETASTDIGAQTAAGTDDAR